MTAMILIPSVNVFQSQQECVYLIQELMPSPLGGSVECGEPITVEEGEFDSRISDLVFNALSNYENRQHNPELERRFSSDNKALAFTKQHLLVNVAKIPENRVRVAALQRRGSSYVGGVVGGEMILDTDSARKELPRLLREAFAKAR